MLILYREINSIGQKLKKVVGKAILFCKLIELSLFFDQKGFNFKNFCNVRNVYCFFFAVKRKIRCKIAC